MDFEENEEQEEEIGGMAVTPGYPHHHNHDSIANSAAAAATATTRPKMGSAGGAGGEGVSTPTTAASRKSTSVRYRECQKNHAVNIGGHAVDGCGEFMAAGEEGTLDALKCAACNCHRNFHRKEVDGGGGGGGEGIYHQQQQQQQQHHHHHPHSQFQPYYLGPHPSGYLHRTGPPHHRPLALLGPAGSGGGGGAATGGGYSREDEDVSNPSSSGGGGGVGGSGGGGVSGGGSKKRFRTKFTQEQKEKMLAFAESLGWRIQKHDEAAVEQFCSENGIKRHVLKVWMHNNKHTLGKKP